MRYALRPRATVAIAESGFKNPVDTNHISTLSYEHLGKGIDGEEAERSKAKLTEVCRPVPNAKNRQPVYTFIRDLQPPVVRGAIQLTEAAAACRATLGGAADQFAAKPLAELMDLATNYRMQANFAAMRRVLAGVVAGMGDNPDPFAVQQLALATCKSEDLDPIAALTEAQRVLAPLDPEGANDPETLGIWGAMRATMAEAHAGLGNVAGEKEWLDKARAFAPEPWMASTTEEQIEKLHRLLAKAAD